MHNVVRTYQPTYQLNPRKRVSVESLNKLLKRMVDSELNEIEYSDKMIPEICTNLAENIRNVVKEEKYDRYHTGPPLENKIRTLGNDPAI
ncbi:unnamed protein product, partial [Leptidea sinapis]